MNQWCELGHHPVEQVVPARLEGNDRTYMVCKTCLRTYRRVLASWGLEMYQSYWRLFNTGLRRSRGDYAGKRLYVLADPSKDKLAYLRARGYRWIKYKNE